MDGDDKTFRLTIASVGETLFDGAAKTATFPGEGGVFEILPHHEPFISTLKNGTVRVVESADEQHTFDVTGGVVEFANGRGVVLL